MKNILFINGCIRGERSNTLRLAKSFLAELSPEQITEVDLNTLNLAPLNRESLNKRDNDISQSNYDLPEFNLAKQFKNADLIVLAAPFWEGTFPSLVHVYLENICVSGLTFELHRTGYTGLCKAKQAVFFTTRGGIYESGSAKEDEHAIGVLKTVFAMLGIENLTAVSAEGLDIRGADVETLIREAEAKAKSLAKAIHDEEGRA